MRRDENRKRKQAFEGERNSARMRGSDRKRNAARESVRERVRVKRGRE